MGLLHLEQALELKKQGARLGRRGIAERVWLLVDEFNKDKSYINAMHLAGKLKAIAQMANCDFYWSEKVSIGFQDEFWDIKKYIPPEEDK
jgi:hypothetical protein